MKARDFMVQNVITVSPIETVAEAAKRMLEEEIGCLIVTEEMEIKGLITDRDLLRCMTDGHEVTKCRVSAHMSEPVVTSKPDENLLNVVQTMSERKIKRLPLVDRSKLVGIVSFSDVSRLMGEQVDVMWSDWIKVMSISKAQARHRRGKGGSINPNSVNNFDDNHRR
jgi:CBS domain-containing protein